MEVEAISNLKKYHPDMSTGYITEMYNSLTKFREAVLKRLQEVLRDGKLHATLTITRIPKYSNSTLYVYRMHLENNMFIVVEEYQYRKSIIFSAPDEGFPEAYNGFKKSVTRDAPDEDIVKIILAEHCDWCIENGFNPDHCKCTRHHIKDPK